MKSFPSLRDFLTPVWRYSLEDKYQDDPNVRVNRIFLKAIDNQLKSVGLKTVGSRADLYLQTARKEHLDYFGSWIGLERLNKNESDEHYRKRLINHIKHPRSTIPALRKAISTYLHTTMKYVHIFEPWQYIFETNDPASRTNSASSLYGYYHRPAIINIVINKPFVDDTVINIINWFRPVGVLFILTYDNGMSADVWHMDTDHPTWNDDTIDSFIGFDDEQVTDLNLLDPNEDYGRNPFYVSGFETRSLFNNDKKTNFYDLSKLNGVDVLEDGEYMGKQYFSYLGVLHDLLKVSSNDTLNDLMLHTNLVNPDIYPRINENGLTINFTHHASMSNMLGHTLNLSDDWKLNSGALYCGVSDKGKNAIRLTNVGASITDTQGQFINTNPIPRDTDIMPRMRKGQIYHIGLDARAYRAGVYDSPYSESVRISVRVDKNQTVILSGEVYSNKWVHLSNEFTYDGSKLVPIVFTYLYHDEDYEVEIAALMLSNSTDIYEPSYSDLRRPNINPNSQYLYAFINVWAFYFRHIESRQSVYNHLVPDGVEPTSKQINDYINKHFNQKYFRLVYKPILKNVISSRLWIMNFDLGAFINYDSHPRVQGDTRDGYDISFKDIAPLINNHGLMVIGLQLPTFHNDYKVKLYHLGLAFGQYRPNETSIKFYKPYPNTEIWWDITTDHRWNLFGGNKDDGFAYDNHSRAQRYYPIRYIRDYIRNVSYGPDNDDRFITNKSLLNGTKLLNGSKTNTPYHIYDWIDRPVLPSLTKYGNPVKSISVLGANTDTQYPANILNNLLKNSVFGYFDNDIWGHTSVAPKFDENGKLINKSSVFMLKDINSDHVWFNNKGAKLWTFTDNIGSRNNYILSFNAKSKGLQTKIFRVRIKLHANRFVQNMDKYVAITPQRKNYTLKFNTYGIFPSYVTFVWEYMGTLESNAELFSDLKKYKNTFKELKDKKITFGYLMNHVLDGNDNKVRGIINQPSSTVLTSRHRPDMVYMPNEPAYIYWGNHNESKVPKPKSNNYDIDDGWNFNGNIPSQYTPALIPKPQFVNNSSWSSNQLMPGYIPNGLVNSNKFRVSYIPDYNGDYALGYNLSKDCINGFIPVQIKNPYIDKFITCDVPKDYAYYTASNADTAEIEFNGIACHLLPKVYIDGKLSNHLPPQINYEGQDTLAYNDIVFGQPINEHDMGETFGDLSRYANDFSEFKKYNWTFGYLLNHIMLPDNITWDTLKDKHITWNQLEAGEYTWSPVMNVNKALSYAQLNPKADPTTFADLIKASRVETFRDEKDNNITFDDLKAKQITFRQLRDGYLDKLGLHESKMNNYTWADARNDNWLFEDGEPFDHSEHCVTIDLGRTYENISHLLVHHGSASIKDVVYDSCLQTSIDGKHWHTWYDNYKGTRQNDRLDPIYTEPTADPVSIPITRYDCFNNLLDFNKYYKDNYYYVSNDEQHYPVKSLSSLLFNDDRTIVPIYSQTYWSTDAILSYYLHSLNDMLKYKLTLHDTHAKMIGLDNHTNPMSNLDNTQRIDYSVKKYNPKVSSPDYFVPVSPVNNRSVLTKGITPKIQHNLGIMLFNENTPMSHNTTLLRPNTKKIKTIPFFLNDKNSKLNSWSVLQSGVDIPTVHHYDKHHKGTEHGDIPNPEYSPYMYNSKLLKFNLNNIIHKQYPQLEHNLKKHGISDIKFFTDNLFANCSTLELTVKGQITGKWIVSVWDYSKQSWQRTSINTTNDLTMIQFKNFVNLIHNGNLYILIMAYVPKKNMKPVMSLNEVDLKTILDMRKIDQYDGGLYPHLNLLYNDDTIYHAPGNSKTYHIQMPWIDKQVLGHKIMLSFNMISDTNFGSFNVSIGKDAKKYIPIEKGYQNFTFEFDIPHKMKNKHIIPMITIPKNIANIYICSVKAEIGIKQSGYTYPLSVI